MSGIPRQTPPRPNPTAAHTYLFATLPLDFIVSSSFDLFICTRWGNFPVARLSLPAAGCSLLPATLLEATTAQPKHDPVAGIEIISPFSKVG